MEGTPQIDILMIPVMKAIKKHVKDRDAQTEIYNRAYEAIQISMDVTPKEAMISELSHRTIEEAQSATIARLTAVLRQAEWVYSDSRKQRECPVCRRPDNLGHHNNCKLNNALTAKEGEK